MLRINIKDIVYSLLFILLFFLLFSKEHLSIVYINVEKVFNEFQFKKDIQKDYLNTMMKSKNQIDSLTLELAKQEAQLKNTDENKEEKLQNLMRLRQQHAQQLEKYNQIEIQLKNQYDQQIFKQLNQYMSEFSKEHQYDMILGSMGNGNIMQASDKLDVTDEVILFINKKYNATK